MNKQMKCLLCNVGNLYTTEVREFYLFSNDINDFKSVEKQENNKLEYKVCCDFCKTENTFQDLDEFLESYWIAYGDKYETH